MNGNVPCVREVRSRMEFEALMYREAEIALRCGYNLATVMSLHPLAQEVYWQLKNREES